jgi:hypothetical protein
MQTLALLLSRLLAILSASVGMMSIALMTHSVLTPQTRGPRVLEDGPPVVLRFGVGGVCAAIVLGLLSYALARFAASRAARRQ